MFPELLAKYIGSPDRVSVERAIAELRAGRPVVLEEDGRSLLLAAAESADRRLMDLMTAAGQPLCLVLTAERLRHLGVPSRRAMALPLDGKDGQALAHLLFSEEVHDLPSPRPGSAVEARALDLMKLTFLLPAVLAAPLTGSIPEPCLRVSGEAVAGFHDRAVEDLAVKARAPDPMMGAENVEVVIFQGGCGMRDQVGLIIGAPDPRRPVLVRLHSACLLGDLFGSLRCDCGEQLRDAVETIAAAGGGVLLYLDQEGRGIGLRNKIRAYRLQSAGYDTVEADSLLGYGPDQRRYAVAGRMLTLMGYRSVVVMTENAEKLAALEACGLDVTGYSDGLKSEAAATS
jgi:GTP cyclohydrolase II